MIFPVAFGNELPMNSRYLYQNLDMNLLYDVLNCNQSLYIKQSVQ